MRNVFRLYAVCCTATILLAQAPSPALLVLNKEEATLAIVDPSTGKVSARIPTGESPHEIAASADGKQAYVTNYGSRTPGTTLSVIDVPGQKELRRVDISPMQKPHGITVADGKVWFTAEGSKLIGRYDPAANRVDQLLGTGQNGTHMVEVSRDNSRIYTSNIGGNSISIFDRGSGPSDWNQTVVEVGKGPEGFDLTSDGKFLWAAQSRDGGISIIDVAAKKVVGSMNIATKRSNRLKFTLDGKLALVSDLEGGELVVIDAASRKQVKRIPMGRAEGILMDPSGTRAFIAVAGENHIAILDLKSLTVTGKLETGKGPDGMAWAGPAAKQ